MSICPEYATLAINLSLLRQWQFHLKLERKDQIYGWKTDSYLPVPSKSARSRHYYLECDQKWYERSRESRMWSSRQCTWVWNHAAIDNIDNQYSQSIVGSREPCRNNKKKCCLRRTSFVDVWSTWQLRPDTWCRGGRSMPRAGSHCNFGTSRGPDKIGSRAGPGPRAVSCTWLI